MKPFVQKTILPVVVAATMVGTVVGYTTTAIAQTFKPAVIAVVDQRKLFSDSKVSKDIRQQLTTVSQGFATTENTTKDKLLKEKDELDKQRGLLVQEAFEEKYNDLKRRADQLNRQADLHQKQLNVAQVRANQELQQVLMPIISQVSDKKGATIVLEASQVVHVTPGLDITAEIVSLLDQKLPTLKIKLPTEAEIVQMEREAQQQRPNG